jgi:hypothetical protein
MSTIPSDTPQQPGLFDSDRATVAEVLREQLTKARSESERARIRAQLQALADNPAGAFWNGRIWVRDSDIPF